MKAKLDTSALYVGQEVKVAKGLNCRHYVKAGSVGIITELDLNYVLVVGKDTHNNITEQWVHIEDLRSVGTSQASKEVRSYFIERNAVQQQGNKDD